ncbi:hypothetical protein Y919_09810 [Caloranaerobacter azorensis H53214]|uniref:Uncharacterized protein n=1 Tax=Caloranaerobacter azorensis H53214 TaxID=1156417 RepID=A0A096BF34_9FIRM|nr:hypothetical protein [Caloranaerobacter azorensis]KGG79805.1 hypothetical protein Y919_09810 [Caloranaerobacter azorensis H53214]
MAIQYKKFIILIIIILCIISLSMTIKNYISYQQIKKHEIENVLELGQFSDKISFHIDEIKNEKDKLFIRGWAILRGQDNTNIKHNILLKDKETGKYYSFEASNEKRIDITKHFNDGYNYDNAGFIVKIDNHFNMKKYDIGIQIILGEKKYFVLTDIKL